MRRAILLSGCVSLLSAGCVMTAPGAPAVPEPVSHQQGQGAPVINGTAGQVAWAPWSTTERVTMGDTLLRRNGVLPSTASVPNPFKFVRYHDAKQPHRAGGSRPAVARYTVDTRTMEVVDDKADYAEDEFDRLDGPNVPDGMIGPQVAIDLAVSEVEALLKRPFPHAVSRREIDLVGGRYYIIYAPAPPQPAVLDAPLYHAVVTVDGKTRSVVSTEIGGLTYTKYPPAVAGSGR